MEFALEFERPRIELDKRIAALEGTMCGTERDLSASIEQLRRQAVQTEAVQIGASRAASTTE